MLETQKKLDADEALIDLREGTQSRMIVLLRKRIIKECTWGAGEGYYRPVDTGCRGPVPLI